MFTSLFISSFCVLVSIHVSLAFLEPGKWSFSVKQKRCHFFQVHKALYKNSAISIRVACDASAKSEDLSVRIGWVIRQSPCFDEYMEPEINMPTFLRVYYECPSKIIGDFGYEDVLFLKKRDVHLTCNHLMDAALNTQSTSQFERTSFTANQTRCIEPETVVCDSSPPPPALYAMAESIEMSPLNQPIVRLDKRSLSVNEDEETVHSLPKAGSHHSDDRQAVVPEDGVYLVIVKVVSEGEKLFDMQLEIDIKGPNGYLSAVEYPLLIFYAFMCIVYLSYAVYWSIVSAMRWRDLLRIQFWIGGVILLGMIEKAVFYAEHSTVNTYGQSTRGVVLVAELISCLKRTLARMLVVIVSLGFGIVKPRLGSVFHRVVSVGLLYFVLSAGESTIRVYRPKNDPTNQTSLAGIPLALLDSAICWWVFSALVQTTRTLRLRRNSVKLSLYTHFTNTLVIAVIVSVLFMVWEIHSHKLTSCLTEWKKLWLDEAFWHLLFSAVLLMIMILWRPTNNNQRYAFTPLLDYSDDEEPFLGSAADGAKLRQSIASEKDQVTDISPINTGSNMLSEETEADLKWVRENVNSSVIDASGISSAILDSDEEALIERMERNKME